MTDRSQIKKSGAEKGERPKFDQSVPQCYRNLIEKCLWQDPKERPSFDDIFNSLKNDPIFITEKVNKEDFNKYVNFVKSSTI